MDATEEQPRAPPAVITFTLHAACASRSEAEQLQAELVAAATVTPTTTAHACVRKDGDLSTLHLVPHVSAQDMSSEPLVPSILLRDITRMCGWPVILAAVATVGVGLSTVALGLENEIMKHVVYVAGFFCLLMPLAMNTAMYYRGIVGSIMSGFEFWYLSFQIVVFSACETVQAIDQLHLSVAITPRIILTGVACVALLCIDGSHLSRGIKGGVMLVATLLFFGLGAVWRFNNATAEREVNIGGLQTTVGSLATSSYLTLALFCGRIAFQALVLKREVMLVSFAWTADTTALRRRAVR